MCRDSECSDYVNSAEIERSERGADSSSLLRSDGFDIKPFTQIISFVFAAKPIKPPELAISEFQIKTGRLKAESVQKCMLAASLTCFAFRSLH